MKMLASILLLLFSMLAHSNAESVGCKGTGKPSGPSFCFAKKVGTDYICAGDPSTVNRNFKVAGWEVRAAVTITFLAPDTYGAIKGPGRAGTSYVPEHWVVGADGNYFSLWHADECTADRIWNGNQPNTVEIWHI